MKFFSLVNYFERRWGRKQGSQNGRAKRDNRRLAVETLEQRNLLSNYPTIISSAVLPPNGSASNANPPTIQVTYSEAMGASALTDSSYVLFDAQGSAPLTATSVAFTDATKTAVTVVFNSGQVLKNTSFTLYVRGDAIFDAGTAAEGGTALPLSIPGTLATANFGTDNIATVNLPSDALGNTNNTLQALSNYTVPPAPGSQVGSQPEAVALADVNRDGLPDLIVVDSVGGLLDIFDGQSAANGGGFSTTPLQLPLPGATPDPVSLVVGAFTSSGLPDIAVADNVSNSVDVFLNKNVIKGVTAFGPGNPFTTDTGPAVVTAADLTGSGHLDLITANNAADAAGNYTVSVLTGNGDGTFNAAQNFTVGNTLPSGIQAPGALAEGVVGDNAAGLPDLVVSGTSGGTDLLVNTSTVVGTPNFTITNSNLSTSSFTSLAMGALQFHSSSGKTVADVVGDIVGTNEIQVFTNDGTGNFAGQAPIAVAPASEAGNLAGIAIGQTTSSGQNDVLVTDHNGPGAIELLVNTSTGSGVQFAPAVSYAVDNHPIAVAVGNVNSNKFNGVVTANEDLTLRTGDVSVYQSNGAGVLLGAKTYPMPAAAANPLSMVSADINGDGIPDLIVVNNNPATRSSFVTIFLGNADGTFQPGVTYSPSFNGDQMRNLVSVVVGSVTGGANPDILVLDQTDSTVGILKNNITKAGAALTANSFTALKEVVVGDNPTQLVLGYFGNRAGGGGALTLDLAVAHDRFTGLPSPTQMGVSILLGNGDGTFGPDTEYASSVNASAIAVGYFTPLPGQVNVLDFVVTDGITGDLYLFQGDGTGASFTQVGGAFATGLLNPDSIAVADFNNDGFPDVVVASGNDNAALASGGGVSVLLNNFGSGFGAPQVTNFAPGVGLQDVQVADLNHDGVLDLVVSTIPGQNLLINSNFYTLFGQIEGTNQYSFIDPHPYLAGGFPPQSSFTPAAVTIADDPWMQVTTFTILGPNLSTDLVVNPTFSSRTLNGEQGSLAGWTSFNSPLSPGSNGQWAIQTGGLSPLSNTAVAPPPNGLFQAMLDQEYQIPLDPLAGTDFNLPNSYAGSTALYQDIAIPANVTSLSLSLNLNWLSFAPFTDTSTNPALDFRTSKANQQIRVDIMDPTVLDGLGQPLGTTDATGVLDELFATTTNTALSDSITITDAGFLDLNLASFAGRTIRIRIATTNNQGQLIVGVNSVSLAATFIDTTAPTVTGAHLANAGYMYDDATGSTTDAGALPHTTDTTISGNVNSIGTTGALRYLQFDATDGNFTDGQFKSIRGWDVLGNFSYQYLGLTPGTHTIYYRAEDNAGNYSAVGSITFVLQSTSFTDWQAVGPDAASTAGQGVEYTDVTGRITATVVDPNDPTGNHIIVGSANSGVWESYDGGKSWTPKLEYATDANGNPLPVPVGAIAISTLTDSNPNPATIYVGTGVADLQLDSRTGIGLFKSTDGGATFQFITGTDVVFGGARISAMALDANSTNILYVGVASGGEFGPGVYLTTDGGLTWKNIMNPTTNMFLPSGALLGGQIESVTALVMDPTNTHRLLVGIGDIGLTPGVGANSGGVWLSANANAGNSWTLQIGGQNTPVTNANLPSSIAIAGDAASGTPIGRVTIAIAPEQGYEGTVYILMGTPPAPPVAPLNLPGVDSPTINYGHMLGLFKTYNNLDDFTQVSLMVNVPYPPVDPHYQGEDGPIYPFFVPINVLGNDAANAGALLVDATDPNVVYVGGSTNWDQTNNFAAFEDHALIRVDTGDMAEFYQGPGTLNTPTPGYPLPINLTNNGDDVDKQITGGVLPGYILQYYDDYPKDKDGHIDPYVDEGVSWYDVITNTYGNNELFTSPTSTLLPPAISVLTVDPAGGIYIGTNAGFWHGQAFGIGYDYSSDGQGIMADIYGLLPPATAGFTMTSLNNNLQIASLTSVAIDTSKFGHYYTSELATGSTTSITDTGNAGITYLSQGLVGPTEGALNFDVISSGSIQISAPAPTAIADTPPTIYRSWEYGVPLELTPEVSTDGGTTFNSVTSTGINAASPANVFPAFAINPNKIFDSGLYNDELLFGTNQVYLSRTNTIVWDPISFPLGRGIITALAMDQSGGPVYYAGENTGQVFVTQSTGADNWPELDAGMPHTQVNAIAVNPLNSEMAFAVFAGTNNGHVFMTTNGGKQWTDISGNLPKVNTNAVVYDPTTRAGVPNGTLYIGDDIGAYFSLDFGKTWFRLGVGLPNVPVVYLELDSKLGELAVATQGAGAFLLSTDHNGPFVTTVTAPVDTPTITSITVSFNKPINAATLPSQVTITDPNGNVIPVANIALADATGSQLTYVISFAPVTTTGFYTVTIGSQVADFNGNLLDQDQDGVQGQADDVFVGRVFWEVGVNFAPVLNTTAAIFPDIKENSTAATTPVQNVTNILGSISYSDANPGAVAGIAVNGVDDSHGDWQYSTDGALTWNDFGLPTDSQARLLASTANDAIRFIPNPGYFGPTSFTFRVWDLTSGLTQPYGTDGGVANVNNNGGSTAYSRGIATATANVFFVNVPPTFTPGPDEFVLENSGPADFPNWATNINPGQASQSGQIVTFIVSSNDPALFAVQPAIDTSGNLTFTPNLNATGIASVTVVADNHGGTANGGAELSSPISFNISVGVVNQPPTFTKGPDESVIIYSTGTVIIPGWATNISPGPPVQSNETVQFIVTNSDPALFTIQPSISPNGTLTFLQNNSAIGDVVVTVELKNSGGTVNGGVDTSAPQTFFIHILPLAYQGSASQVWISQAYRSILHREIDAVGLQFWSNLLDNGLSRYAAAIALTQSTEYRTDYVNNIYENALGRPVDPSGLQFYLGLLGQGDTFVDVRARILASDEFYFGHGTASPYNFLNQVYLQVFGRAIDPAGVALWGTLLAQTGSRYQVALDILTSGNAFLNEVNTDYVSVLGRPGDLGGLNFYTNSLLAGNREETVIASMVTSLEIDAKLVKFYNPTPDTTWLNQVYTDLLNRPVDSSGISYYTTQLLQGTLRNAVVTGILSSGEYRTDYINQLFTTALSRLPSPSESFSYLQALSGGATFEQIESMVYGSSEYYDNRGRGNNLDYLRALYADILALPLDDAGIALYGGELAAGVPTQTVALSILTTPQAAQNLVSTYYTTYLRRPADPSAGFWSNALVAGMRNEVVLGDIIGSAEYYTDFS